LKPAFPTSCAAIVVLLILATLVPLANAGSPNDPEISDGADDVSTPCTGTGPTCPAQTSGSAAWPAVDIRFAWITENATHLQLYIQVTAKDGIKPGIGPTGVGPTAKYDYTFRLVFAGVERLATLSVASAGGADSQKVVLTTGGVAKSGSVSGNVTILDVPKTLVGSPSALESLTGLYAKASGKNGANGAEFASDRAPNTGSGRDYVVKSNTEQIRAPTVFQKIDTDKLEVNATFSGATSRTFSYNWTKATASNDLSIKPAWTAGSAQITVRDNASKILYTGAVADNQTVAGNLRGAAGTWRVVIEYFDYKGGLQLLVQPHKETQTTASPTPGTATPTSSAPATETLQTTPTSPGPQQTTSSSQATGTTKPIQTKGSPGPALPLVVAALLAFAVALRRRRT
jgi:hypothetical protein